MTHPATIPLRPLLILGTRPEAIKMAPLVRECLRRAPRIDPRICFTGQHAEMLRQVTDYFDIAPHLELNVMSPGQSLAQLTARCLTGIDEAIHSQRPDCVIAQGDTVSVLAASMSAFFRQIPFVHVEGGLRTGNLSAPFPEEYNRRVASISTTLHCAPTAKAAAVLLREGYPAAAVRVTGNTVIDALEWTSNRERQRDDQWRQKHAALADRQMVLITTHRRENFGAGLENICRAIQSLARDFSQVVFVLPVHLNPQVRQAVEPALAGLDNVLLLPPLPYPEFVWMMDRARLILTDSGGVQEEAPSLRKPVVVMRESTERGEAVDCGAVILAGSSCQRIVAAVTRLLTDPTAYAAMQVDKNPYGDGRAAIRIVDWLLEHFRP